jgi:hypothetical protein
VIARPLRAFRVQTLPSQTLPSQTPGAMETEELEGTWPQQTFCQGGDNLQPADCHSKAVTGCSPGRRRRRNANRLGFAVHLAYLRFPDRVLGPNETPPAHLLSGEAGRINPGRRRRDSHRACLAAGMARGTPSEEPRRDCRTTMRNATRPAGVRFGTKRFRRIVAWRAYPSKSIRRFPMVSGRRSRRALSRFVSGLAKASLTPPRWP